MRYLYLYGGFAVVIAILYALNKGKGFNLPKMLQHFRAQPSLSPSESTETVALLEEMYKEFMFAIDDMQEKHANQQKEIESLREQVERLTQQTFSASVPDTDMTTAFTIKEATKLIGISESTLRKWEREFADFISFQDGGTGGKRYKEESLAILFQIKFLRDKRVSTNDIKAELAKGTRGNQESSEGAEDYHQTIHNYLDEGLSVEDVAKKLGVSVTEIQIVKNGRENVLVM